MIELLFQLVFEFLLAKPQKGKASWLWLSGWIAIIAGSIGIAVWLSGDWGTR